MSRTQNIISFLEDQKKMENLLELLSRHKFDLDLDFKDEQIKFENLNLTLNGNLKIKISGERLDKSSA
ncbi:MAG: hypothetical protein KAJ47_02425 [Candidatus Aenigmarchaeota archaeon]|nr:hypothetical protein [Candidatus Aenigmarchaeota archaeon]